jgi:hypothetical protein
MNSKHTAALVKADYMKLCAEEIQWRVTLLWLDDRNNPDAVRFARTIAKQLESTIKLLEWGAEEVLRYGEPDD